jgi:hypothetical protein
MRTKLSRRSTRPYADNGVSTIRKGQATRVNACILDTFQRTAGSRTLSGQRSSPYRAFLHKRRIIFREQVGGTSGSAAHRVETAEDFDSRTEADTESDTEEPEAG